MLHFIVTVAIKHANYMRTCMYTELHNEVIVDADSNHVHGMAGVQCVVKTADNKQECESERSLKHCLTALYGSFAV